MSGRVLKGSKSLLSLSDVFDLTEASAYRVTPTYVYAFKKSSKGKGIVPVHIKHGNIPKHWEDLVDPEAGTPLANTVIGLIPKYYKAVTDLKPLDPTKSPNDLVVPDGGSESPFTVNVRQTYSPEMPAKKPTGLSPENTKAGDVLAAKLGYKAGSKHAKMLGWIAQTGTDTDAAEGFIGPDGTDDDLDAALELAFAVVEKLKNPKHTGLAAITDLGDGEESIKFSPSAISPGFDTPAPKPAPVSAPPPPPPAPAPVAAAPMPPAPTPLPTPTPAPAPVAKPSGDTPSAEAPTLVLKGKEFLKHVPDNVQLKLYQALGKKTLGDATFVALGVLMDYDDSNYKHHLKTMLQKAIEAAYPNASSESVLQGVSGIHSALVAAGIVVESPGGDEFLMYGPQKAGAKKKQPEAPPPVAAPAPASAPKAPTAPGLGAMFVPPLDTLMYAGDAKGTLGGYHAKTFLKDGVGTKYLFKPGEQAQARAGQGYATLAAKILDHTVPVVAGNVPGQGFGTVQPLIPNVQTDLSKVDLTTLTKDQLDTLMKERVADWALASHDTKAANFILTTDGKLVGIDKEQALKFIGGDELSLSYKPNPTKQVYSDLFDLYRKKKLDLGGSLPAMQAAIEKVEAITDAEWKATLQPYLDALPHGQKTAKAKAILDRKKNVRKDFEAFITGLLRERGDINPNDDFKFSTTGTGWSVKKKKKPVAVGGLLTPPQAPAISELTPTNLKVPGSTGESYFYKDAAGNKYVVKLAVARDGSGIPQPYRAAAQEIFSQVSSVVRPGKSLPVATDPVGAKGVPATVQPWIEGAKPIGKSTDPSLLPESAKKDIAEEHALDWLLSQHDTHGDNLLVRPDGTVLSIDKEQGFKYFLGDFKKAGKLIPGDDKLSTDYHPNAAYGEAEAYSNKFWRSFAGGQMSFDPTVMKDAISRIESLPDSEYVSLMSKFAAVAPFKDDPKKVQEFIGKALTRKQNIRKDFEEFISGLYEKRTKKKGKFSFAGGWVPSGSGAQPSAETPAEAPKKKKKPEGAGIQPVVELASGLKVQVASSPGSTGSFGVLNPKMHTAETVQLATQAKAPVPAGYPEPAPGKMWKQSKLSDWLSSTTPNGNPVLYKEKAPKKADASGNMVKDESSPNVMVKLNVSAGDAQAILNDLGISADPPVFEAGGHAIAIVNKEAWQKAKAANKTFTVQVNVPPQKLNLSAVSKFTATPEAGQLSEHVPATVGLDSLDALKDSKNIGYGRAFAADGGGVNLMSLAVQRCEDAGGTFFRFSFKIRPEQRAKLVPNTGTSVPKFSTKEASYDKNKDAWVQSSIPHAAFAYSAQQWNSEGSTFTLGNDLSELPYSARNLAFADVRLKPNETLQDGLKRVLSAVSPALATQVLKEPTPEDIETMKLSAYLWAFAPQTADALPESKRNPTDLKTAILNAVGKTADKKKQVEEDLQNLALIETGIGQITVALKGRGERMQKKSPKVRYVVRSVAEDLAFLEDQIKGATISMRQRLLQGVSKYATSGSADFKTGGGDYAFANVRGTTGSLPGWGGGGVQLVYDPSELDRLDAIAYTSDAYGTTNPTSGYFTQREPVENNAGSEQEIIFRSGLNHRKLLKVMCRNKGTAEQLIQRLKQAGVDKINGMLPEELVVYGGQSDASGLHSTYLKPAGY